MAAARPAKPVDESTYGGRFAQRLKALREKAGKTVDQLAGFGLDRLGPQASQPRSRGNL